MILTAKTEAAFCVAANLPCSLPLGGWVVDVDPEMSHALDPEDYVETSQESAFEQFQARIRASERLCCEADLYWRCNRWDRDEAPECSKSGLHSKAGEIRRTTRAVLPALHLKSA